MPERYEFFGNPDKRPQDAHPESPEKREPYIASDELKQAVNLSIYLRRPLLLEGEPGCGKTKLARAVAYELGLPFYPWYVRSTTKATEGFYSYDALARLHDVQISQRNLATKRDPSKAVLYRKLGALGKAFRMQECPAVVLIDEIDKADMDFPNDLLAALDEWRFDIPETGETIKLKDDALRPIVFITSNKETGDLPAPFLRRCLYHYVQFPDEGKLREIVAEHSKIGGKTPPDAPLLKAALARFAHLREENRLHKNPGTSELLDWLNALQHFEQRPYPAKTLEDAAEPLPYPEILLKLRADWHQHAAAKLSL